MPRTTTYRTTKLVWLLAGIGLATGAVTLAIVGGALWSVMRAQQRHDEFHAQLSRMVDQCESWADRSEADLRLVLEEVPPHGLAPQWLAASPVKPSHVEGQHPQVDEALRSFRAAAEELSQFCRQCAAAAEARVNLHRRLLLARQRSETALYQLRTVEDQSLPGGADRSRQARKAALNQMQLAFERLVAASGQDELVHVRDEQFVPALDAFRAALEAEPRTDEAGALLQQRLADVGRVMIGGRQAARAFPGESNDALTPADTLWDCLAQRNALEAQRAALIEQADSAIERTHAATDRLGKSELELSRRQTAAAGVVFQRAWRAVLLTGATALGFFLGIGCMLPKAVAAQIESIRQNLDELDAAHRKLQAKNAALEIAQRRAETAAHSKTRLLALLSRQARQPLAAMCGSGQLLAPGCASEPAEVLHHVRQLEGVLADVQDLCQLEAGELLVCEGTCGLLPVLQEAVSSCEAPGSTQEVSLRLVIADKLPEAIQTDAFRLERILVNLVSAAVEMSPPGEVRITARWSSEPGHRLEVDVADEGPALSVRQAEQLLSIMGPNSLPPNCTGGLKLYLARQFAVALGGDVWITWQPGQGNIYRLELPAQAVPDGESPARKSELALAEPN